MNKIRFFIAANLVLSGLLTSCDNPDVMNASENYFIKYYGEDGDQTGVDLIVNDDGTVLMLGNSNTADQTSGKIFVVKADENGALIWQKIFGSNTEVAVDMEPAGDGNFIILSNYQQGPGNVDVKLIKIDPDGNKLDSVVYGSISNDYCKSITPISDGGFIITGTTEYEDSISPPPDVMQYRCDAALDFFPGSSWRTQYGQGMDYGTKTFQKTDSLFYVFGHTNVDPASTLNTNLNLVYYYLDATGGNGNPVHLGDVTVNTTSSFVTAIPGSGYLIVSSNIDNDRLHLTKLRELGSGDSGNPEFDKDIIITDDNVGRKLKGVSAIFLQHTSQGFLVLADETSETGETNIWLSKTDLTGTVSWSSRFGSSNGDDTAGGVAELPNGKILIIGTIELENQQKMALIKLNHAGKLLN